MSKRVLITGASGFIGNSLLKELQHRGCIVLGLTFSNNKESDNIKCVNLLDKVSVKKTISEFMPDKIIHLAAIANVNHNDFSEIYKVNIIGSEILLDSVYEICPSHISVMLASTAGVYGNQKYDYLHERLPMKPVNHYSYSKMVMEMLARQYEDDIKIHIIRPFNIIGAGQTESFLIPKIVRHFFDKKNILKLGNIDSIRDYVEVKKCAWMIAELMMKDHKDPFTLNLCSGLGWSGHDVLDCLTEISGYRPKIEISNQYIRKNEVWRLVGEPSLLAQHLGQRLNLPDLKTILQSIYSSME